MFKNENYITIQGWMINELRLNGNKLNMYALIYGFSQDGVNEFKGSLNYIMGSLLLSKNTCISLLKDLVKSGFIIKEKINTDKGYLCTYKANLEVVQKLHYPSAEIAPPLVQKLHYPSAEIAPNNYKYNTNNIYIQDKNKFIFLCEEILKEKNLFLKENINYLSNKYDVWKSNDWKNGHGKPIKNFKSNIIAQLPYLPLTKINENRYN